MSSSNDTPAVCEHSAGMAAGFRTRTGLLLLLGCASVAIAFGASFYFALISNQTAIARQVPELSSTVERFKGMLLMNTFLFVSIIIASFWLLARMITARLFAPLGTVMSEMKRVGEKRLPEISAPSGLGPFGPLEEQWAKLLCALRTNEEREIAALRECAAALGGPGSESALQLLQGVIERKETRIGSIAARPTAEAREAQSPADPIFMQPF